MTMWVEMKQHFTARQIEWFSAVMLWAWGSYVLLHPGLFRGPASSDFLGMRTLAPQQVWGYVAFFAGNTRVAALFINGKWGVTPLIRILTSFMSIFVWFWICVGLYLLNTPTTGFVMYGGLLLADMTSAFRAAGDAYEARENKRRLKQLSLVSNVHKLRRA